MTLTTGEAEQQVLETTYWWGVPTLFRCPHDPDLANCDIGLVGIPHSAGNGTTEHDQHLGPRAVRHVSPSARRVHNGFGLSPWEAARINDQGGALHLIQSKRKCAGIRRKSSRGIRLASQLGMGPGAILRLIVPAWRNGWQSQLPAFRARHHGSGEFRRVNLVVATVGYSAPQRGSSEPARTGRTRQDKGMEIR